MQSTSGSVGPDRHEIGDRAGLRKTNSGKVVKGRQRTDPAQSVDRSTHAKPFPGTRHEATSDHSVSLRRGSDPRRRSRPRPRRGRSGFAPPAPVVEAVPAPPSPGNVRQPGYWSWNGVQYVWVPGEYVAAPYIHAVWVPGAWIRHGPGWVWVTGGTGDGEAGGACLRRKQSRLLPESPICGQSAPRRS